MMFRKFTPLYPKPINTPIFIAFLIAGLLLNQPAYAQIGPNAPTQKPMPENSLEKLKNLKNFFSGDKEKKENTEPDNVEKAAEAQAKQQAGKEGPSRPKHQPLINQPPLRKVEISKPTPDTHNPPPIKTAKLDDPKNKLGLTHARNRLDYVDELLEKNSLVSARTALEPLKQWLIECTEAHINLYKSLKKIPSAMAQAELEKQLALEFALLRDRSMFEMGKLYAKETQYQKAVKELVEVIKSQPKSKIGLQSYELLQNIGFTEQIRLAE